MQVMLHSRQHSKSQGLAQISAKLGQTAFAMRGAVGEISATLMTKFSAPGSK
jgi:hypothetical protein